MNYFKHPKNRKSLPPLVSPSAYAHEQQWTPGGTVSSPESSPWCWVRGNNMASAKHPGQYLATGPTVPTPTHQSHLRAFHTFLGTKCELGEVWPETANTLDRWLQYPSSLVANADCPARNLLSMGTGGPSGHHWQFTGAHLWVPALPGSYRTGGLVPAGRVPHPNSKALTRLPVGPGALPLPRHHSLTGHLGGWLDDAVHDLISCITRDTRRVIHSHSPWTSGSWRIKQPESTRYSERRKTQHCSCSSKARQQQSTAEARARVEPPDGSKGVPPSPLQGHHSDLWPSPSRFWPPMNPYLGPLCHTTLSHSCDVVSPCPGCASTCQVLWSWKGRLPTPCAAMYITDTQLSASRNVQRHLLSQLPICGCMCLANVN